MQKVLVFFATCLLSLSALAGNVQVDIVGMTCGMCEGKVTESLTKTGKTHNVKVDVKTKKATFETKGELTDAEIKAAVKDAGYEAVKITRS
jgi:copper chaperone